MGGRPLGAHGTAWIAVQMAWCAGFVDAVAYNQLQQIYTSHMTGNTASLANHLLHRDWHQAARFGWVIVCFMMGLVISASLTRAERRRGIRRAFAASLALELALLGIFIWMGTNPPHAWQLAIFLPGAAMGVQTVTVTRVGYLRVYTTYLTGSLSKLSEAVSEYAFWFWDRTRGRLAARYLHRAPRDPPAKGRATGGRHRGPLDGVLPWGILRRDGVECVGTRCPRDANGAARRHRRGGSVLPAPFGRRQGVRSMNT